MQDSFFDQHKNRTPLDLKSRFSTDKILDSAFPFTISLIGIGIIFKDLLAKGLNHYLYMENNDTKLMYWTISWGYHILVERGDFRNFWNANSFYPNKLTLTQSDSFLGLQLFTVPLHWLGLAMLPSIYLGLALTLLLSCILTIIALRRIGGFSTLEQAFIVFGSHFGLNTIGYLFHYQLFGFELVSPYLLYLYLFIRDYRIVDLCFLVFIFVLGVCFAIYLGPILVVLSIFAAIFLIVANYRQISRLIHFCQHSWWKALIIILPSFILLYSIQLKPYFKGYSERDREQLETSYLYSAHPLSIFNGKNVSSYWYKTQAQKFWGAWEGAYFPGYILLSLGLIGFGISGVRALQLKKVNLREQTDILLAVYACLILILCLVFSFGSLLRIKAGMPEQPVKLPYYYLAQVIPGLSALRSPGRFGMFIGLPLSMLTIFTLRRLRLSNRCRQAVLAAFLIFVAVESWPTYKVYAFNPDPQGVYTRLANIIKEGTPILELPLFAGNQTIARVNNQLVGSTIHWAKLPVGYGAKSSPQYHDLVALDQMISANDPASIEHMIKFAKKYSIKSGLIHQDGYSVEAFQKWLSLCKNWPAAHTRETTTFLLDLKRYNCLDLSPPK